MMLMPTTAVNMQIPLRFPISRIVTNRRPIRHQRKIIRIERLKFLGCVNRLPTQDS